MKRTTAPLLLMTALGLSACGGRFSDSGLNPLGWFSGGPREARTLDPKGGYATAADPRQSIGAVTSARWEPLNEGRLLVVEGMPPTKGYWQAALITDQPNPTGRLSPGPDGVLRLRFVVSPPAADSVEARMPARPDVDTITVAATISNQTLAGLSEVVIVGLTNSLALRR